MSIRSILFSLINILLVVVHFFGLLVFLCFVEEVMGLAY